MGSGRADAAVGVAEYYGEGAAAALYYYIMVR